ncbi:amino acid permease-domain-containing protein [Pseudoneurospora amorphoporcata]|uniref:Amino acid permease-domain-containing protein n=1 Tax=Pseudoneurospora amorphoporcata TaxID=241081 RepID=A0AAN6NQA5_9PEZI|nr:amino acid permease-domain-containing protein [Pseudoneurospora amorphoporcata]
MGEDGIWALGFLTSIANLSVYLEYASYFPNRSGSEVVYLDQAYPRPRWMFPTAFAFQSVALSFNSSNAIVLAQYLFRMNGHSPTAWELKGVTVAGYTVAASCTSRTPSPTMPLTPEVSLLTRSPFTPASPYHLSNGIGIIKVLTLVFVSITGLVVLGGHVSTDRIPNPRLNFRDSFSGEATAYGVTNALYKIIFSYAGFENAFNVVKRPVKQVRRNGFVALLIVAVLYILANVAYFAAVPKEKLVKSQQIAASLFLTRVFGSGRAMRGLNFLIALSSFGNLVSVLIGSSRLIRECERQGWALTILMILAPPAGDAFNFITDLQVLPSAFFQLVMGIGLYVVRSRRSRLNLPGPEFKDWDLVVVFNILVQLLIACAIYYYLRISIIPKLRGYRIQQEVLRLEAGAQSHKLVKVPVAQLAEWEATHDVVGRPLNDSTSLEDKRGMG